MSLPWFRMYAEFAGDPVIQSLTFDDQRHYVILLCLKCAGTLDRNIVAERREAIIRRGLGLETFHETEQLKARLRDVGLIDENWQPLGWDKRQYHSDVSTDRVRKYRKSKETGNVSGNNGNSFGNGPDTESESDTESKTTVEQARRSDVLLVFSHWQKVMNHPHAKLTPERQRKITNALKNYSAASLCKAVDGCSKTPHNMGQNDRHQIYDDIELILRDASHIERFMRNAERAAKPVFQGAI